MLVVNSFGNLMFEGSMWESEVDGLFCFEEQIWFHNFKEKLNETWDLKYVWN